MANRFHNPRPQFMNATPAVYGSGVLRFYTSGTSTPKNVYTSDDLVTGAATSVTLNSAGRPSQDIWLSNAQYKVTLEDSLGNLIWTVDPYYTTDYSGIARVQSYAGNPNGNVAGTAASGSIPADLIWDRTNQKLYVCTTTGVAAAAVWTVANVTALQNWTTAGRNVSPTAGVDFGYNTTLNIIEYWNGTKWFPLGVVAPTVQRLTSGSAATYTAPAGVVRQRVRMAGPGGGGAGATANNGSNGSADTTFQVNATGTAWSAKLGAGGTANGGGGGFGGGSAAGGGAGTDGSTGTLVIRIPGTNGSGGQATTTAGTVLRGGDGGTNPLGGGSNSITGAQPNAPAANTGAGGGGGGGNSTTASGGGGGAGEYVEFWVTGMTSATYTIGTGGANGAAGTNAGRTGSAGIVIVEEFYS